MSFILNALKKSDGLRDAEQVTDSGKMVLDLGVHHHNRRSFRAILLLLPLALLIGWWLGSSPISKKGSTETAGLASSSAQPQPAAGAAEQQSSSKKAPATAAPTRAKQQPTGMTHIRLATAPVPLSSPSVSVKTSASQEDSRELAPAAAAASPLAAEPIPYPDLPRQLRQALPPLEISLHFFSDNPERRMVRINNHFFREGETVATGLTIHGITPSATIFDYRNLLFEVDKPGG